MFINIKHQKLITETALFFIVMIFLIPHFYYQDDMDLWQEWALALYSDGLKNIYEHEVNYQPLFLYCLYGYSLLQGSESAIVQNITYIKIIPLLFDIVPASLLIFINRPKQTSNYHLILFFNIAYLYNSMVWGQVDSIHTFLSLAAIFFAFRYPFWSVALFILAFNTKIQSIIFLPILAVVLLLKIKSVKKLLLLILWGLSIEAIILLPFLISGKIHQYLVVITGSIGYYPIVSMNAFNFWYLISKYNPMAIHDDTLIRHLISYKKAGLLLFLFFSTITLIPLLIKTIRAIFIRKISAKYYEIVFLTSGLVALIFFYFNTEMHERYSHPALLSLFFYGVYKRNFNLYILVSIAYFLNMEKVLQYYMLPYDSFIFHNKVIASLFLAIILIGLYRLYGAYNLKIDLNLFKAALFQKDK